MASPLLPSFLPLLPLLLPLATCQLPISHRGWDTSPGSSEHGNDTTDEYDSADSEALGESSEESPSVANDKKESASDEGSTESSAEETKERKDDHLPPVPTKMPSPDKLNDDEMDKLTELINKVFASYAEFHGNVIEHITDAVEKKKDKLAKEKLKMRSEKSDER